MNPRLAKHMDLLKPEGAYAVLSKAQSLEREGKDIIHLEIGQPDFPTPQHIVDAGIEALHNGKTKYNPPRGIPELRDALATYLNNSRNIDISAQHIAVTPSGKTAIYVAMMSVLEKGDEVMYPDPGFPTYRTLIDVLGCKGVPMPLQEKSGFSFDIDALEKDFSHKTKLIILNSPSNPTGGVIPDKDLARLIELVKDTDCWIMSDEIYTHIVYDANTSPSFYKNSDMHHRTILVDGFSKTYSMTGWRLGYVAVPESIINQVDYLLTHMVGCTATFTQYAGLAAVTGPTDQLDAMVAEFNKRRDYVVEALNDIPGITCQIPQGAFYVFPNISSYGMSSQKMANYLLEEAGVALLAGTDFGPHGEGYVRLSYATSLEDLQQGIERIKKALQKI